MTDIMAEAVEAIEKNLEVLFLTDLLNLILKGRLNHYRSSGVRISDDETDVTLSATLETFQDILQGDLTQPLHL
ncbi:MAG: hypothetical protein CM15mP85_08430 [Rhodobacterales bacterium]|nr:MAG: hypothetical protein CM15mP85_08430 [Rhodobacterales bacterium]